MMQQSRSNWIQIQGSYLGVFGRAVLLETSNSQDAINVQKTGYTHQRITQSYYFESLSQKQQENSHEFQTGVVSW